MPPRSYEDFYIGLLNIMTSDRFEEVSLSNDWPQIKYFGRMDTQLAYSYNGLYWYRTEREPFIGVRDYGQPLGAGRLTARRYCARTTTGCSSFVVGDYGGHAARVDKETRLAIWQRLPQPDALRVAAGRLLFAQDVGPRGGAAYEGDHSPRRRDPLERTLDGAYWGQGADAGRGDGAADSRLIRGRMSLPVSGDHLYACPRWRDREDIAELVDRPVRVEIAMREAELFAIRLECDVYNACEPLGSLW